MGEARERLIGYTDLKITDENVNYDSVSSFNADITNRNQGEDLDDSIETNEDSNKHNKFRENLSLKNPRVNLTTGDLNDLSHNRMLNDSIIQTFQQMLKIKYPDANGLQDPVLGQTLAVQVLHDGSLYWIAISTYNCKEREGGFLNG